VTLEHLWAGWRAAYVGSTGAEVSGAPAGASDAPGSAAAVSVPGSDANPDCVFCAILASDRPDAERLVVWEGIEVVVIMNAYPYSTGHVMAMPRRHVRELEELTPTEAADLWSTTTRAVVALKTAYNPDGCNVGLNLGRAAGAGIPGHLHVHAVPRWVGDTNFMTATAGTRVLPEALGESWQKVRAAWS
jgi:ATP adenylyltransferase